MRNSEEEMDIGNALESKSDIQPALLLEALLSESKQLQVTSLQLIRASNELQTTLVLLLHQQKHLQKRLIK